MGLELIAQAPEAWAEVVIDLITSPREKLRKLFALRRKNLYRDNFEGILEDRVTLIFKEQSVRQRMMALIPLAGTTSVVKRVADELARPIYARAPGRRVVMPGDTSEEIDPGSPDSPDGPKPLSAAQKAWNGLVDEADVNETMDMASRLIVACTSVLLFVRYVDEAGVVIDLFTPDQVSVIPNPKVPKKPLAFCYERSAVINGRKMCTYVVWDDKRTFSIDQNGNLIAPPVEHGLGRLPIVEIHRRRVIDGESYWDEHTGKDLESAGLACMFYDLITSKKHKSQSHIQLAFTGEADSIAKDQTLDEESILVVSGGGANSNLFPINLESDASSILTTKTSIQTTAAANYGISLDRLNQRTGDVGEDQGLKERVAELSGVMMSAEKDLFAICKIVSQSHDDPSMRLPADATQIIDFGLVYARGDRMKQLLIRSEEKSQGIRSTVDDVLEDNPEFGNDRSLAFDYINQKMAEEAVVIMRRRALNMPADATAEQPGSSPEQNGKLGPAVRDGQITAEQAADASENNSDVVDTATKSLLRHDLVT